MDRLAFDVDTSKYALVLLICAALVALGIGLVAGAGNGFGRACAVFFGACAGAAGWQMSRGSPRLAIDDAGLLDRALGVGVIVWDDVLGAEALVVAGQPFVELTLRDPEVYLDRLGAVRRKIAEVNSAVGIRKLSLNLSGLEGADPARIAQVATAPADARRAT